MLNAKVEGNMITIDNIKESQRLHLDTRSKYMDMYYRFDIDGEEYLLVSRANTREEAKQVAELKLKDYPAGTSIRVIEVDGDGCDPFAFASKTSESEWVYA